jgi:LTXXQ motif family protein
MMNRGILAGAALLAGVAVGSSTDGMAQTAGQQSTQAPDQQDTAGRSGMMGGMGTRHGLGMQQMMPGMMDDQSMGPMSRTHQMMRASSRERCDERIARRAAVIAYTTTKLNLTAEQKQLWDKLNGVIQAANDRERQLCASLPSAAQRGQDTILNLVNRREQFLSARLQALQQAKPALDALYQSLSPDQKAIINHPFRR